MADSFVDVENELRKKKLFLGFVCKMEIIYYLQTPKLFEVPIFVSATTFLSIVIFLNKHASNTVKIMSNNQT